jgi:hypothetical protein
LASEYVIEEAKRNLLAAEQLRKLDEYLEIVQTVPEVDPALACPIDLPDKDRPVLMAAIGAKSDYFITSDISHFGKYFGQTILGIHVCLARDYISTKIKQ